MAVTLQPLAVMSCRPGTPLLMRHRALPSVTCTAVQPSCHKQEKQQYRRPCPGRF
jgi:hypothetical protein